MSLNIKPLSALKDNYIWLLQYDHDAVVVDPGQAEPVIHYLREQNLQLTQIWITHPHVDHTGGVLALKQAYPDCLVRAACDISYADDWVQEGSHFMWYDYPVDVWQTAGHTNDHVCYQIIDESCIHLFCGDTLFSAGCGRVLGGSVQDLFRSVQRINKLPANTLLYPAHEYTAANLDFAEYIEPNNADIQVAQVAALYQPTLPVTLEHERRINPFLRVHHHVVQQRVCELTKQNISSEEAIFIALRTLKNIF